MLPGSGAPTAAHLVINNISVASSSLRYCEEALPVLLELVAAYGKQEPFGLLSSWNHAWLDDSCLLFPAEELIGEHLVGKREVGTRPSIGLASVPYLELRVLSHRVHLKAELSSDSSHIDTALLGVVERRQIGLWQLLARVLIIF